MNVAVALLVAAVAAADPEAVFRDPPPSAKVGVWWHWMGSAVTREGIVRDLDWMRSSGVGTVVAFAGPDVSAPGKVELAGGPAEGLVAATPAWWRLVRFAVAEALRRGLEIGLHNCPGYSHSGGPWTRPEHAMRELVFEQGGQRRGVGGKPYAGPLVDARDVARVAHPSGEIVIRHVAKPSFNSPAPAAATGYECDKMSPAAVNAHWDRVLGDVRTHLGDFVGKGFNFLHVDSYEAGTPSWTPDFRREFQARRGYDPLPYLPSLAGFAVTGARAATFARDFDRTVADLYRDVFFRISRDRLHAAGLAFSCEPYTGPFETDACAAFVDRVGTEFWSGGCPWRGYELPAPGTWDAVRDCHFPTGVTNRLFEAEALTGWPESSRWDETPARLKPYVDFAFARGINRLMLHSVALQPWGDGIRPGMTFGCWGTHFGRTQTWATDAAAFFAYIARCQALLQWGERADGLRWPGGDWGQCVRAAGDVTVRFLFNPSATNFVLSARGAWFDPATGAISAPPAVVAPGQSGFLVTGRGAERPPAPPSATGRELAGTWTIDWASAAPGPSPASLRTVRPFFDWTMSGDDEIRHFSGTATYRLTFDCPQAEAVSALDLGDLRGNSARVRVNGVFLGTAWAPPRRLPVPPDVLRRTGNRLEIEYTNVWANRLIGDERFPDVCERRQATCAGRAIGSYPTRYPAFLATGAMPPDTRRRTFSMWNHFTESSRLVPSGLVGPIRLLERERTDEQDND